MGIVIEKGKYGSSCIYDAFHDGEEHGVQKPNSWHPLYVWKPFSEILSSASQTAEKENFFDEKLIKIVKDLSVDMYAKVKSMPTFQILRAALEKNVY